MDYDLVKVSCGCQKAESSTGIQGLDSSSRGEIFN